LDQSAGILYNVRDHVQVLHNPLKQNRSHQADVSIVFQPETVTGQVFLFSLRASLYVIQPMAVDSDREGTVQGCFIGIVVFAENTESAHQPFFSGLAATNTKAS